jgi:hypothetical protein
MPGNRVDPNNIEIEIGINVAFLTDIGAYMNDARDLS